MDNNKLTYLTENKGSQSYLVTYSKLDHKIFPTQCRLVCLFLVRLGQMQSIILYHYHYHAAIRLNRPRRWKFAKTFLKENFKIIVHFGVSDDMYAGAYRYATKSEKYPFTGHVLMKHPNLEQLSETYDRAIMANSIFRENCQQRELPSLHRKNQSKTVWRKGM